MVVSPLKNWTKLIWASLFRMSCVLDEFDVDEFDLDEFGLDDFVLDECSPLDEFYLDECVPDPNRA